METEQIIDYLSGINKREKREIDFYDLMLFAGFSFELANDLRRLNNKLPDVSKYAFKNVYIHGIQGCGKTVLAGHIFAETLKGDKCHFGDGSFYINRLNRKHEEYDKDFTGPEFKYDRFCWYPGLIQDVKKTFNKKYDGPSEHDILDKVKEASVLVLDDIGKEFASEWSRNFMYLLIEERKVNLRPTIFTSNCSLSQLAEKYDSHSITSRIAGICQENIIKMKGNDRRIPHIKE